MIWRRRRPAPDPEVEEARRGLEQAERDLAKAKGDRGKVEALARRMEEIRRTDRLAAIVIRAMRGHP